MANMICENCNGRGTVPVETDETCGECEGTGEERKKAWTFRLTDMAIVESNKGENETTIRFVTRGGGIEVIVKINFPWPMGAGQGPPAVGSHYDINFRGPEEDSEC